MNGFVMLHNFLSKFSAQVRIGHILLRKDVKKDISIGVWD